VNPAIGGEGVAGDVNGDGITDLECVGEKS
jgi:hypothetical protein